MALKLFLLSFVAFFALQSWAAPIIKRQEGATTSIKAQWTHNQFININSFSWGPANALITTGQPSTLKVALSEGELSFPSIEKDVTTGANEGTIELIQMNGATGAPLRKIIVYDCIPISFSSDAGHGEDIPTATIEMAFPRYRVEFYPSPQSNPPPTTFTPTSVWKVTDPDVRTAPPAQTVSEAH